MRWRFRWTSGMHQGNMRGLASLLCSSEQPDMMSGSRRSGHDLSPGRFMALHVDRLCLHLRTGRVRGLVGPLWRLCPPLSGCGPESLARAGKRHTHRGLRAKFASVMVELVAFQRQSISSSVSCASGAHSLVKWSNAGRTCPAQGSSWDCRATLRAGLEWWTRRDRVAPRRVVAFAEGGCGGFATSLVSARFVMKLELAWGMFMDMYRCCPRGAGEVDQPPRCVGAPMPRERSA